MREEMALKINLPESRVQVSLQHKHLKPNTYSSIHGSSITGHGLSERRDAPLHPSVLFIVEVFDNSHFLMRYFVVFCRPI